MSTHTTSLYIRGSTLAKLHTLLSGTAFSLPSFIGDWYPERNIFQFLIAINSGPRFILLAFGYLLNREAFPSSNLPGFLSVVGVLRTLACGGWVYITSSDNHDVHDVLMILYIVLNLPWMYGNIRLSQGRVRRQRSYTRYAFFEWSLILFDILYDSVAIIDLGESRVEASLAFTLNIRYVQDPAAARDEMYQLLRHLV
ncbi:Frag1/DRAM/Sfk1 family-domain-containing protein [Lactarius hatsudake]|nr:Frag1/DRAM/Sfk1 family-domain-containing protein [Lactarius hatsudake]